MGKGDAMTGSAAVKHPWRAEKAAIEAATTIEEVESILANS